ncbi:hypothetical protein STCU_06775 [Strigomonas culicis]|uniref:Uncharacterized protein n=1 Tax=Strigomonas culicis TaxID=28005 RepID=S9VPR1_9TRYP|nr:hypothetical protein STCU_06775 [Strigomonas culicis]|eukprot:EPY25235.1 hypothetical protein STCU_06775 [Strigomonas culicis]
MHGAAIFFIVVGSLLAAYFLVGSLVRYHGGLHRCPEVLPNYRFWCGLVALLLRLLTCGRVQLGVPQRYYTDEYHHQSVVRSAGGMMALPRREEGDEGRRGSRRSGAFSAYAAHLDTLPSDGDDYGQEEGLEPADVVVKF